VLLKLTADYLSTLELTRRPHDTESSRFGNLERLRCPTGACLAQLKSGATLLLADRVRADPLHRTVASPRPPPSSPPGSPLSPGRESKRERKRETGGQRSSPTGDGGGEGGGDAGIPTRTRVRHDASSGTKSGLAPCVASTLSGWSIGCPASEADPRPAKQPSGTKRPYGMRRASLTGPHSSRGLSTFGTSGSAVSGSGDRPR
jgi:hypothetical protein